MSVEYNDYLKEHIMNVQNAEIWLYDNIDLGQPEGTGVYSLDHDESKFSDIEYPAYDNYFYGGNKSYEVKQNFEYAWLHHIHNNPHHWQYWVLFWDDPTGKAPYKALEMPKHDVIEMIADWWSFSWKSGNLREIFKWYDDHKKTIILNENTRELVEDILGKIKAVLDMQDKIAGRDVEERSGDVIKHEDEDDQKYGLPKLKKYPMPDSKHVRSAIRFFNYVDPENEEELANAILARMKEYGMSFNSFGIGDENRFKKYMPKDYLGHTGILGMKWGVRNGPPYPLKEGERSSEEKRLNDTTIEKGTKLYRVTFNDGDSDEHRTYVSGNMGDASTYALRALFLQKANILQGTPVIKEYIVNNNMKMAGENTIREAHKNIISKYNDLELGKMVANSDDYSYDDYIDFGRTHRKHVLGDSKYITYHELVFNLIANDRANNQITKQVYDSLKKSGYDGMVDIYDLNKQSSDPYILFSNKKDLEVINTIKLNQSDTNRLRRNIKKHVRKNNLNVTVEDLESIEYSDDEENYSDFMERVQPEDAEMHGILGQRWGKRNGPPYPLDESDYSKAERNNLDKTNWTSEYNRREFYNELEDKGYTKNQYGDYYKEYDSPDKNIKRLTVIVDGDDSDDVTKVPTEDLKAIVDHIDNNIDSINTQCKKNMAKAAIEYRTPWSYEETDMSKEDMIKDLEKKIGTYDGTSPGSCNFRVSQNGNGEVAYDDGGAWWGHYLVAEVDWRDPNLELYNMSVNG